MAGRSAAIREQKISDICTLVQKEPGKHFNINVLSSKIGSKWDTTKRYVDIIVDRDSQFSKDSRGRVYYASTEGVPEGTAHDIFFGGSERKGMDRMPITKNESGCSDPTAAAILMKEKKEERRKEGKIWPISSFKIGDIWSVSSSSGGRSDSVVVLGINKQDERIVCCPYDTRYYRAYMNLFTKPAKYFISKIAGLPISKLTEYQNNIRMFLGIEPEVVEKEVIKEVKVEVPVEVEKIVEKEVVKEVPAPKIGHTQDYVGSKSDKEYTKAEVDMLLAEQKAEIYEKCFNAVALLKK